MTAPADVRARRFKVVFTPVGWQVVDVVVARDPVGEFGPGEAEYRRAVDLCRALERLEYLRGQIEGECISYGEIAELQGLAAHIAPGDAVLLQWAGMPEFPEDEERAEESGELGALRALEVAVGELVDGGYIEPGPRARVLRSHLAAIQDAREEA